MNRCSIYIIRYKRQLRQTGQDRWDRYSKPNKIGKIVQKDSGKVLRRFEKIWENSMYIIYIPNYIYVIITVVTPPSSGIPQRRCLNHDKMLIFSCTTKTYRAPTHTKLMDGCPARLGVDRNGPNTVQAQKAGWSKHTPVPNRRLFVTTQIHPYGMKGSSEMSKLFGREHSKAWRPLRHKEKL